MTEIEQIAELCTRLGAAPPQAQFMATQLWKRAEQLAQEHGTTHEAELRRLLELLTQGRAGEVPKNFVPPPPRPPR